MSSKATSSSLSDAEITDLAHYQQLGALAIEVITLRRELDQLRSTLAAMATEVVTKSITIVDGKSSTTITAGDISLTCEESVGTGVHLWAMSEDAGVEVDADVSDDRDAALTALLWASKSTIPGEATVLVRSLAEENALSVNVPELAVTA